MDPDREAQKHGGIRIRIPNTGWEVTITFQELKRGAAACGDVADLVLGIVLGRTRRGVPSTCTCQHAVQVSMSTRTSKKVYS